MENKFEIHQKEENYELFLSLKQSQLSIKLLTIGPNSTSDFHGNYSDDTLASEISEKFGGIQNIYSLLEDKNNYFVNVEDGEIELALKFSLPNGKKIIHKGTLELTPVPKEQVKSAASSLPQLDQFLAMISGLKSEIRDMKDEHKQKEAEMKKEIDVLKQSLSKESIKMSQEVESHRQMMEHSVQVLEMAKGQIGQMKKVNSELRSQMEEMRGLINILKEESIKQKQAHSKTTNTLKNVIGQIEHLGVKLNTQEQNLKEMSSEISLSPKKRKKLSEKNSLKKVDIIKYNSLEANQHLLYLNQFKTQNNTIQFIGADKSLTQFLLKPMTHQCSYMYVTFRILKTSKNQISIGLIDNQYALEKYTKGNKNPHYIRYHGQFGSLYEGGKLIYEEGEDYGFQRGQDVQMITNFDEGWVQWWVDKNARIKHHSQILKDKSIDWVPHIVFCNQGDLVEVIESS